MARNQHAGICYQCGERVAPLTGHFERHQGRWRVKHANISGYGRITCEMTKLEPKPKARVALAGKEL